MKKALLMIFCLMTFQAFAQTTEIIATGIGANEDEAKGDALVVAIEQAIGVMVSSELIIENGKITRDWIKTRSDGIIESYRVLASGKDDNSHYVTIRAVVSQTALGKELEIITGTKVEIDGASVAVNLATKQKLYDDLVKEFPFTASALVQRILSSCELSITGVEFDHTQKGSSIPFVITVEYNINKKTFNEALVEMDKVLTALGAERTTYNAYEGDNTLQVLNHQNIRQSYEYAFYDKTYALVERHFLAKLADYSKTIVLTIYENDYALLTQKDTIYSDANGADIDVIIVDETPWSEDELHNYMLQPRIVINSYFLIDNTLEKFTYEIEGTIGRQAIDKITSIEVSFPTD